MQIVSLLKTATRGAARRLARMGRQADPLPAKAVASQAVAADPAALDAAVLEARRQLRATILAYRAATGGHNPPAMSDGTVVPLRASSIRNGRLYTDRNAMMTAMAKGQVGAEIGVQHGNFSRFLLDHTPVRTLHLFDIRLDPIREDIRSDPRCKLHIGDSAVKIADLPDAALDWAYIDGDHRFSGVMKDARAILPKLRPGGLLFFNDYTLWSHFEAMPYGVVAVVNQLAAEGHELLAVALNPWGYYDVALRPRPHGHVI